MNSNLATFMSDNGFSSGRGRFPFTEQYLQIGTFLSSLEASTLRVGVICPFPTAKIRGLFAPFRESVGESFKINLTNVKTEVLESYLDDLKQMQLSEDNNKHLHLTNLSELERYGVVTLLSSLLLVCSLFILGLPKLAIGWAGLAMFAGLILLLWFAGLGLGSELYRRNTFIYYLNREIMRRKGMEKGQTLTTVRAD
ncbi:MAG: hypothetical protein IT292_07650 [Deltaproteobacteria bacterium]|nr:hypothetical protein [Deltaproteobacteria bacterium]